MANPAKQKLLVTTSNLLERQGYHATGLKQILEESGTPRGSLYYYFPDGKEALAAEAITQRMNEMANHSRHLLGQVDDPAEAIYAMIRHFAEMMQRHGCGAGAPIAAVALEASNSSERLREACAAGYDGLQAVLAAKLVMGGFSAANAAKLAAIINASIEGAIILVRTKQDPAILFDIADAMKTVVQSTPKM
ncbi:MAG: TetR/AcrR family transcriptional regulator [Chloroflexota bacterium]